MKNILNTFNIEKLKTRGNAIFLLVFSLLQFFFLILYFYEGSSTGSLDTLLNVFMRIFYLAILVAFSTEKTSGFLAKQLSNGMERKSMFISHQVQLIIFSMVYYLLSIANIFCIAYFILEDLTDFNRFILSFLPFIVFSQLGYLFILFFKKTINAVLVTGLILGVDFFIFEWLLKYSNSQLFYLLPHSVSMNFSKLYMNYNLNLALTSIFGFILLLPILSYFKLMKTNFND